LNRNGQQRPSGKPWTCQQIGRVLDNPAYAALCIVDDDFVPGVWNPIIDGETWDQVRAKRATDTRRHGQLRVAKGPYLLSGLLHCGHCGAKLHHRSRKDSANGIYACVKPGGKWCPGGSVDCAYADEFVRDRFLDRCHFMIERTEATTFGDDSRRWKTTSMADRRSLLALAIRRVVLVPWPGGDSPVRTPGARRQLRIEWAGRADRSASLTMIAKQEPPESPKVRVSEGRTDMMREVEVAATGRKRAEHAVRSKRYYEEWRSFPIATHRGSDAN